MLQRKFNSFDALMFAIVWIVVGSITTLHASITSQRRQGDGEIQCGVDEKEIQAVRSADYCQYRHIYGPESPEFPFNETIVSTIACTPKLRRCKAVLSTALQLSTKRVYVFPDNCLPDTDFVQIRDHPCSLPICQRNEEFVHGMPRAIWCGNEAKEIGRTVICAPKSEAHNCIDGIRNAVGLVDGAPWVFPSSCIPPGYVEDPSAKICLVNKCVAQGKFVPKAWSVDFYCIGIRDPKLLTQFDECAPSSRCFSQPVFAEIQTETKQVFVFPETECVPDNFKILSSITCKDYPQFKAPVMSSGNDGGVAQIPIVSVPLEQPPPPKSSLGMTVLIASLFAFLTGGAYLVKQRRRTALAAYAPVNVDSI
eukprot:TRINITY_DN20278_c0_g1_i1.p1 TRINITY_DN20278_c0_g1~~TRINITY_DN20278_c0_g1_i1.p1  ORF type:complete len:366 (-),score=71.83 TRINITY_DN20278_c0_g1_i1:221-1318(-)